MFCRFIKPVHLVPHRTVVIRNDISIRMGRAIHLYNNGQKWTSLKDFESIIRDSDDTKILSKAYTYKASIIWHGNTKEHFTAINYIKRARLLDPNNRHAKILEEMYECDTIIGCSISDNKK